jgi:DNA-binding response OmpR family regulator
MPTILIVDDDALYLEALSIALADRGYNVVGAGDAERALYELSHHVIDAAVVDMRLPGLDGTAVITEFRRRSDTPIVAISGGGDDTERSARAAGADAYLAKPVPADDLHAILLGLLVKHQATTEPLALSCGPVEVDVARGHVRIGGQRMAVAPPVLEVLVTLISSPLQVHSADRLRDVLTAAGEDAPNVDEIIDALRTIIEPDPTRPVHLVTLSDGYRFVP